MATIRFMLAILCFGFAGRIEQSDRYLLKKQSSAHEALIQVATSQIGVKELSNKNDGAQVEIYLKRVGLSKGKAWCAAFVCWVYHQTGYAKPKTGWSPDLFNSKVNRLYPAPGFVIGIYFPELKRIAHVGLIKEVHGSWLQTIEGNTNTGNSREGDGVYSKRRNIRLSYSFSDWITKEGGKP